MKQYLNDLRTILQHGEKRSTRSGDTLSIFGLQTRYNLKERFPAVTTKKLAWKSVVAELLWFLEGSGDERRLAEILHGTRDNNKKTIWTANVNADYWKGENGDAGRIYGVQWRKWRSTKLYGKSESDELILGRHEYIDQIANLIEGIKTDPTGRRHIISAWNPSDLDNMVLPPCHVLSQFYVMPYTLDQRITIFKELYPTIGTDSIQSGYGNVEDLLDAYNIHKGKLSCQMYQRSGDFFLGIPFNLASYSLLTHMIAQVCDLNVGEFIHTIGDAHIYCNHITQVNEQLNRSVYDDFASVQLNPDIKDINDFTMNDITLRNYKHHPAIKASMAV